MKAQLRNTIRAAEKAVSRLVTACRKDGPLYAQNPKSVAHVSRTGKWHLNAIAQLGKLLGTPGDTAGGNRPAERTP